MCFTDSLACDHLGFGEVGSFSPFGDSDSSYHCRDQRHAAPLTKFWRGNDGDVYQSSLANHVVFKLLHLQVFVSIPHSSATSRWLISTWARGPNAANNDADISKHWSHHLFAL